MKKGMTFLVPPLCDPTVPLLGPYQMAGYAESERYPFEVIDYNVEFVKHIVDFASNYNKKTEFIKLDDLEMTCCKLYLDDSTEIDGYQSLIFKLRECKSTSDYWKIVDYLKACYDLYSLQFKNIRFRIDGFDTCYHWNIWNEVEKLVDELKNSALYDLIVNWVEGLEETETFGINITFDSQLAIAILFADAIKEKFPNAVVCTGGGFINSFVESTDSMGPLGMHFDLVCNGEGEALIWHFKHYGCNAYRKNGTKACYVKASDLCKEKLCVYPPKIEKEQLEKYFSPSYIMPLRFTYQCYWGKCKFCTDKEYHACLSNKYDFERMIDFCVNNDSIEGIYFLDSAIPANVLKKFCKELIEKKCSIRWGTNSRFDKVFNDEDFIKTLAEAGCKFIKFGLESGSQRVLDLMQKGTKLENAREIINLCRKYGILVHTYIMFAYPGEQKEDRDKTIEFLLDEYSHPDNYNCSEFIMYGTSLVAKEMNYDFNLELQKEEGWYSSSYSFTNDEIKEQIVYLREKFDEKYSPSNMLISTGHTIAFANKLKNNSRKKIILRLNSVLKKNKYTVLAILDGDYISATWRRRDCMVYTNNKLLYLLLSRCEEYTVEQLLKEGISTNNIYDLINENFMSIVNEGDGEVLEYVGEDILNINYGNKFLSLKWYGYYDVG